MKNYDVKVLGGTGEHMYKILEMQKEKLENGITLVALVITVIVLLILAGVAITSIMGEEGIFNKAKYSAQKYNNAAKNESESLENILDQLNKKASKFELSSNNIKRTSFVLNIDKILESENEIIQYEYFINGESKGKISEKTFKFDNLQAETDYNVFVKAYDSEGKEHQSDSVKVRTADRTYLVKGGTNLGARINIKSTAGVQSEFRADCIYMRSASVYANGNSGYQVCQSSDLIDVTEYTKLYIKAKGYTIAANPISLGLKQTNDWQVGTKNVTFTLDDTPRIYTCDISTISGNYYAYVNCYNGYSGTYTEILVYDMWLE